MDDYPVKLGAMLFTLVDPHRGHEVAYNRWYERDHFYGGCMVGPWILAGGRWVSPRSHKDLRFPAVSGVAVPTDAGSYLATYWVEKEHWPEHFEWSTGQVFKLYEAGRGFDERTHAHTVLYTFQTAFYRDDDGVPVELALDHRFGGLVSIHVDRAALVRYTGASLDQNPLHWDERFARSVGLPDVIAHGMFTMGTAINVVSEWAGDVGRVVQYGARFTKPVVVPYEEGADVETAGVVTALDDQSRRATVELTVTCGSDKVLGRAVAVVVLD